MKYSCKKCTSYSLRPTHNCVIFQSFLTDLFVLDQKALDKKGERQEKSIPSGFSSHLSKGKVSIHPSLLLTLYPPKFPQIGERKLKYAQVTI